MRGEAGQSPDSLSARRPPEGRGNLWALHVGPSAPAAFGRVHWALWFALILLKLCQCQLVAGTCPETIQLLPMGLQHQLRQTRERLGKTRGHRLVQSFLLSLLQPCNAQGARSHLILAPSCHLSLWLPHSRFSQRQKAAGLQSPHLFNVEVGAGTCFVEVHAILLSQLQEKNIPER